MVSWDMLTLLAREITNKHRAIDGISSAIYYNKGSTSETSGLVYSEMRSSQLIF